VAKVPWFPGKLSLDDFRQVLEYIKAESAKDGVAIFPDVPDGAAAEPKAELTGSK
jgi:hypothetical protein